MSQTKFIGLDINKDKENDDNDNADEDLILQWGFEMWDCIDDQALGFGDLI